MNCRKAQKLLPAMAAGELPDTQAHALRNHLEGCADCAAELRAYEESLSALRQSKDRELPEGVWDGYWERIRDEAVLPASKRPGPVYISFRSVVGFAAAAALLVVALVGWSVLRKDAETPKHGTQQPMVAVKPTLQEGERPLRIVQRIDSPISEDKKTPHIYTLNDMARQVRAPEWVHSLPDLGKGATPSRHYTLNRVQLADKDESKYEF